MPMSRLMTSASSFWAEGRANEHTLQFGVHSSSAEISPCIKVWYATMCPVPQCTGHSPTHGITLAENWGLVALACDIG